MAGTFYTVYLVSAIIWGVVWGVAAKAIAKNKGYEYDSTKWFWLGFFFSFIAVIIVATKPNNNVRSSYNSSSSSNSSGDYETVPYNGWRCKNCGRTHQSYEVTCSCGMRKDGSPYVSNTSSSTTNNTYNATVGKSSSKVFTAPENLYTLGSPVIIVEGALLKDQQSKKISAMLKMKNICAKTIKAVKVKIWPLDTVGIPLGDPITHEYLDIEILRDVEFGQEEELPLPDDTTRAFRIEVLRVAFTDNSFWSASEQELKSIPKCRPIQDVLKDYQLVNQYKLEYGQLAAFLPQKIEDLWFCTCGAINKNEEAICHNCGNHLDSLHEINVEELEAAKEKRLEEERKEQLKIETEKRIAQEIAQEKKEEEDRLAQERRYEEEKLALVAAKKAKVAKSIKRLNWLAAIPLILFVIAYISLYLKEEMQIPLYIIGLLFVALPFYLLLHIFLAARIISFRNHNRDIIILSNTSFGLGCLFIIIEAIMLWGILGGENTTILETYLSLVKDFMNMLKALGK